MIPLKIGAWNVRTFIDSAGSDRPQRRPALVGRELGRYGIENNNEMFRSFKSKENVHKKEIVAIPWFWLLKPHQ